MGVWGLEAVGILCLVGYLFYDRLWAGIFFAPFVYSYVKEREKRYKRKKQNELASSFREGMQSISASLAAGYSLENAFREAVGELQLLYGPENPAAAGFMQILHRLSVNRPVEEAFEEYADRQDVEEIRYFAQILIYAKRSGGNLIAIVRRTADMISERIEVRNEILTVTTAKRFEQNIMNVVPLVILAYMRFTSFALMEKLYGNLMGVITMTVCLALYYGGKRLADHIIDIEV